MVNFPFWCPACEQVADASADPIGLLFGGAPDFKIKCQNCGALHRALVEVGAVGSSVKLLGSLEPEEGDDVASE